MLIEYAYCRNAKLVSNRDTGAGACKIRKAAAVSRDGFSVRDDVTSYLVMRLPRDQVTS